MIIPTACAQRALLIAAIALSAAGATLPHHGAQTAAAGSQPSSAPGGIPASAPGVTIEPAATRPEQTVAPLPPLALEGSRASARDGYNRAFERRSGYRLEPNAFLLESLGRIAAPRLLEERRLAILKLPVSEPCALEIAMGDGRNALPLIEHGYRTTGFDISDVGVNHARQRAADLGLSDRADFQLADAYTFEYGRERWDLIVAMYFYVGPDHIDRVKDAVKPRGWIVIECIHATQGNEVLAEFMDWEVIHYEHDLMQRDWAPYASTNPGPVMRLLARKP